MGVYDQTYLMAMPWECFVFTGYMGTIIFAVATDTTISCSLGRKYSLVLKLFFFDIYD
jgi:hypothetical protein